MLWSHLRLQTRILAGYGLMFILIAALVVFLMVRFTSLNEQIRNLSTDVTTEATAGAQISAQVALTQQRVDRYLQQPNETNQQVATNVLQQLESQIKTVAATLDTPSQREQLAQLSTSLATYQQSFRDLNSQIDTQKQTSGVLITQLSHATLNLQQATTSYLQTKSADPSRFSVPQQHLVLAILLSARLVNEQDATLVPQLTSEISATHASLLLRQQTQDSITSRYIDRTLENIQQAQAAVASYQQGLIDIETQRTILLNHHGVRMQNQSTEIATGAMDRLVETSHTIERQSGQAQQWMLAGLVLILVISGLFGGIFPRTITRPVLQLVEATRKVQQGDLDVELATNDRSEIGLLTAAFSQMAAALRRERQSVQEQQVALAHQNQELEQTLGALQASTTAREQLAQTVRMLSVPVVPILKQVILIPLVGEIDASRATILLERLLSTLTSERARTAIIDITGVPMVDVGLVEWLIRINRASELMGARCILVGVSPEVAQALVSSGADVDQLHVYADLRSAVEEALRANRRALALRTG